MMPSERKSAGSESKPRHRSRASLQPTNPERPWCKHGESTQKLWAMLTDGRSNNLCLSPRLQTCQPDEKNAEREPTVAEYQLAKVLVCRQQYVCLLIGQV
jgi:hypothetical protein